VTDVSKAQLPLKEAVLCYRKEYRVERIFNRLKSQLNIAPFFVKREDQVAGLTHLLTLGIRVLTLMEFVVRRSLQQEQVSLAGLHPENPKKTTDAPTAERILKAFSNVNLTLIHSGISLLRHLTPRSKLQKQILKRRGLDGGLYQNLEIKNSEILLTN
jgi:transposase